MTELQLLSRKMVIEVFELSKHFAREGQRYNRAKHQVVEDVKVLRTECAVVHASTV